MGKFRKRVACKGKRWAKGQSSSSNPEAKTFRNAAKSRFFQVNLGNSGLTEFAVRKHEVMFGSVKAKPRSLETEMDDDESVAGTSVPGTFKTFETFASDWSSCSNVSFSKLLTTFSHNSAIHKEMLAILAAVTEVIKEKNGTENSTEYFAALMTLLEGAAEDDDYKEESVSAMLSLLSMGIKTVPRPVLQLKFADASKILMILLSKHATSNNNVIMRSLIGCLSVLLRAQDAVVWSQPSTMKVYESLLSFCAHSKPKIRKAAQHACCAILKASACNTIPTPSTEPSSESDDFPSLQDSRPGDSVVTTASPHPASSVTAAYVIRNIELNPALGGSTSTLHVLGFLKDVISCLSKTNVKAVCESILKVMTLGNVIIISSGLETLHSLFLSSPDPARTLTPQLNAQLINALYDYQPPSSDSQPTQAWLTTLGAAFGNLARVDLGLCMSNLARFMSICTQLWMSDKMEVVNGATHTLQGLLEDCVAKAAASSQSASQHRTSLRKVFDLLSSGLSYQYNRVWNQVLAVLSLLFKVCGATCADFMSPCLSSLAELRDSHNFPCSNEVDYAIGAAVRSMGVDVVLKQIPYQLGNGPDSAAEEIKRSWLLPVLKANIVNASLDLFVDYFLPMATLCRKRSEACRQQNGTSSLAISYNLLQTQIWSLLPAFCHKPRDVSSFPKLAKVLGNVLTSYKDLRLTVMLALRRLMESNPQCPLMRKYAKNYLPILLNIYTTPPRGTDDENVRTATFQTLEMYATRADRELLAELLTSAVNKIKKAVDEQPSGPIKKSKKKLTVVEDKPDEAVKSKEVKFLKASILDVIRVLLPYQHVQDMEELFSFLQETLNTSKDSTEVKKVYRILQELCESDQEGAQTFVKEHMEDVVDILVEPKDSKVATPSHAARLKCLSALLSSMTEPQTVNIIPPAVAGIKSVNSACRDTAFALLTRVADRMVELNPQEGLTSLIDNLSVGLQGVPKLASASILGLASVTHHCRNSMVGTESLSTVISNILVLLTSNTREIVSSCLSFIKLLLTSFHKDDNAPHIPAIVREISAMSHDCKRHFRIKVKDIFVRLLRKYGDDTIFHMIPSHDVAIVKQVKNMIKIRRRKNKEKTKNSESDNEEEEFSVKSKPKTITEILEEIEKDDDEELLGVDEDKPKEKGKKKKKAKQFIQENEDEILDFTDMTNMGKISSSKPGPRQANGTEGTGKKAKKEAFKMSEDGRLIITESDSEDETDKKLNKLGKLKIEDDDEDEEDKEDPRQILKGGKRKRGASEKGSGSVRSEPASKYQAGGSGIHRPVNTSASSVKSFGNKSNKSNANVMSTDVGSVYKSKKSQGDMKRKGLPDPYAYVPLTRKLLNKRKKNKSTGQFKNIVKGAKKGAKIGKSLKSKDKKKKGKK
uniref:RRP12-like protein n=1 Tax=Cacopsylla melanoneura TaxID=428564 RepID=A0A8D8RL83_9HEMI